MRTARTGIQERTLQYLASCNASPTYREIGKYLGGGYNPNTVRRILDRLEKKGLICRTPGVARSIRVIATPEALAA
jgi:DNA-binding MarR family transcriptional regulator